MPQPNSHRTAVSLVIIFLVIGVYAFFHSPVFTVKRIKVSGSTYSASRLAEIAGIERGTNLLRLDVAAAARRLEKEPIILRAVIRRHLPDTVYIRINERTPIGMIPVGSGFWGVSADGVVLGSIDVAAVSLPIITGVDTQNLQVGEAHLAGLILGSRILSGLPSSLRDDISEVNVADHNCLRLITRNLVEFRLGEPVKLADKLQVVATFLPRLEQMAAASGTVVDVSTPTRPVVRQSSLVK